MTKLTIPAITSEQLYLQDKRRRNWDEKEREMDRVFKHYDEERNRRVMSNENINWGFNCLTSGIHHGRPEAIWNLPLLQANYMFNVEELQTLVTTRIYNDAMLYVEHGLPKEVRPSKQWAEKVERLADQKFSTVYDRKRQELLEYYNSEAWLTSVSDILELVSENKLNPGHNPLHSHDSINMLCRILGTSCTVEASREL